MLSTDVYNIADNVADMAKTDMEMTPEVRTRLLVLLSRSLLEIAGRVEHLEGDVFEPDAFLLHERN